MTQLSPISANITLYGLITTMRATSMNETFIMQLRSSLQRFSGSKCQAHYRHKTIIPVATKMLKLQRVEKDIGCGEEGVGPE